MARSGRTGARGAHPVCVAVLDLDEFKAFNDEHGHQAGDRLLADASWDGAESGGELFGRADAALYDAKQAERGQTVAAPEREAAA